MEERLNQWYEKEKKECQTEMEERMLARELEKKRQILQDGGNPFEETGGHYVECIGCGS